jgi:glycerate kinase
MRILATFDKFKDALRADQVCKIVSSNLEDDALDIEVLKCPLTDGGEGFVDVLSGTRPSQTLLLEARNSFGKKIEVSAATVSLEDLPAGIITSLDLPIYGTLFILEMASVCGLSSLLPSDRNPWDTSTEGVGDLLKAAKEMKADAILLGIGGSSTNDAGIGALCSLGLSALDSKGEEISPVQPSTWHRIDAFKAESLVDLPKIRIACDVENPLLGPEGATFQFAPQKGLPLSELDALEERMCRAVDLLDECFSSAKSKALKKGAGAAGGIGFGLSLAYDVKLVSGFQLVSDWLCLPEKIESSDLVITGEGKFDRTSLAGKGPYAVLQLANEYSIPKILVCGKIDEGIKEELFTRVGDVQCVSISQPDLSLEGNLAATRDNLSISAKKIKATISEQVSGESSYSLKLKFKRIRRIKKFLRPLPRRSNVHRYPVLKWFSQTAYKRSYLWSFRRTEISSALFWGVWISMLPIVGVQMIVVFFVSLLVRANLPLIVALQWISNPLTMGPIYFADYKIGLSVLNLLGVDYKKNKLLSPEYNWSEFSFSDLLRLIDTFPPMMVGGSVLGISLGLSVVFLYKTLANFYKSSK